MGIEGIEHLKPDVWNGKIDSRRFVQDRQKQGKTKTEILKDLFSVGLTGSDPRNILNLYWEEDNAAD